MRKAIANRYAVLGHPLIAAVLSMAIILAFAAWAASKLPSENQSTLGPPANTGIVHVLARARNGAFQPAIAKAETGSSPIAQPQIARTGRISLYVSDVEGTVRRLSQLARTKGGDVFSLTVSNEDQTSNASAQMDLRVPAGAFDQTMNEAAKLGKVRERSTSAEDLTGEVTDSSARLRNLRQTEADIRKIMDRSGNVSQVMDAENQLSQVREQIETLESSLASMRGRVVYSTVSLDVEAEVANQPVEPTAASQLANAWHAAVHALGQTAIALTAMLLWVLAFMPFLLGACALLFLLFAVLRRRAALGQ